MLPGDDGAPGYAGITKFRGSSEGGALGITENRFKKYLTFSKEEGGARGPTCVPPGSWGKYITSTERREREKERCYAKVTSYFLKKKKKQILSGDRERLSMKRKY